jgi:hypothetical protein
VTTWTLATELAIWTLIVGSLAVFAWFLLEVVRLAKAEVAEEGVEDMTEDGTDGPER